MRTSQPEGLACAEGFEGLQQEFMARQSATTEGPVRAVNDFLSGLVLEAPVGQAAEVGVHLEVVGIEGDPYVPKGHEDPPDPGAKKDLNTPGALPPGAILESIRRWYAPAERRGLMPQMTKAVPPVEAMRRQEKLVQLCSVMPELYTVLKLGPAIVELAARWRYPSMNLQEQTRWVHGDWGREVLTIVSLFAQHRDALREMQYVYSLERDETHTIPWSELLGVRFGAVLQLLSSIPDLVLDDEQAVKRKKMDEADVKQLFLMVIFVAETRHSDINLPQFPFTKHQCDQMLERWTTAYSLNGGEMLLLITLCALGVPGALDAQKASASPSRRVRIFLLQLLQRSARSAGLTATFFLDQLPILSVIHRRQLEVEKMLVNRYGGMVDLSFSTFQKALADLGQSRRITYGQVRDIFMAFIMRLPGALPELQSLLANTGQGLEQPEPMVPLKDAAALFAVIGILNHMEEPSDESIALGLD